MKKIFRLVAVSFAVVAMASCNCGGNQNATAADSTASCCDTAKKECVDSTAAAAPAESDSAAKREINANDIFAKRMDKLTKELILDDAQQAKLAEILTVGADRIEKYIDANEKPSIDEIKKFHAEEAEKVKAILNGDQFAKFQKLEEETAKRFEERVAAKAKAAAEAAVKAAAEAAK
ncbi:MAG: hypothetical protein MJZ02_08350 [Paludibacteraceae bacterium]|nr:hypothetical protein [Paludibacteraceae bacterium]